MTQIESFLSRIEHAVAQLPWSVTWPVSDHEIEEEILYGKSPSERAGYIAYTFGVPSKDWELLGSEEGARAALQPIADQHGCELRKLDNGAFLFTKQ